MYSVNEFEIGKPVNIEKDEAFNIDSNCHEFVVNIEEEKIEITDIANIKKPIIDESIKRPLDKFLVEQFEKLTGGFQLNVKDDFSQYYSINFQN